MTNKEKLEPILSVVIPTFNRSQILGMTLDKLSRQTLSQDKFEVLVVDDGSTDGTNELLASLSDSVPFTLRCLTVNHGGPGNAQNKGIREAAGEIVLLLANDILATPNLLEQHLETHKKYCTDEFAVLGNVVQSSDLPKTLMHRYWDPFSLEYSLCKGKEEVDGTLFLACNISVKKKYLIKHGLFRERPGAALEDIELGYRLKQQGLRIIFNEKALGHHYHPVTLRHACQRSLETGLNFDLVADNIPRSIIFPMYRMVRLEAGLGYFIKMLPHEILRRCVFNRVTVKLFWIPVLEYSEKSPIAAIFACRRAFHGVEGYHHCLGYKTLMKRQRRQIRLRPFIK